MRGVVVFSFSRVIEAVVDEYVLGLHGIHGPKHWARVFENTQELCRATGADPLVCGLFAVIHDSKRLNEGTDPNHGPRAAEFVRKLWINGFLKGLGEGQILSLVDCCHEHTYVRNHSDLNVRVCADSDRLDIGRIGVQVDPRFMLTQQSHLAEYFDPAVIAGEHDQLCDAFANLGFFVVRNSGRVFFEVNQCQVAI